jgi:hypothetical protein
MILNNINNLIEEVESFGTIQRIFRYNPLNTLYLWIYRAFNYEVIDFLQPLLEKIDDIISYFDSTDYKASKYINKIDLGELINKSKLDSDSDKMSVLKNIFTNINQFISSLFRCYIDELVDNKISVSNVTSVSSLLSIKNNSDSKQKLVDLVDDYTNLLSKKPTSALNVISELKRRYMNSKFINEISLDLDKHVASYVATKQELSDKASIMRKSVL